MKSVKKFTELRNLLEFQLNMNFIGEILAFRVHKWLSFLHLCSINCLAVLINDFLKWNPLLINQEPQNPSRHLFFQMICLYYSWHKINHTCKTAVCWSWRRASVLHIENTHYEQSYRCWANDCTVMPTIGESGTYPAVHGFFQILCFKDWRTGFLSLDTVDILSQKMLHDGRLCCTL